MPILSAINPYLAYIKIAGAVAAIAAIFAAGIYARGVVAERDALKAEQRAIKAALEQQVKAFDDYVRLNAQIAENIKKIKVNSNVYIENIEREKRPEVPAGSTVTLIPAGMPKADLSAMPEDGSAPGRDASSAPKSGSDPAGLGKTP